MKTKHTPGPWEIKEVMGQKFVAAKPYEGHPYFNRTTTIEIMSDEDYPTKEGDVCLLAAAPELLAASEEAMRWLDNDGQYLLKDAKCETKHDCVEKIRAAITKAVQGSGTKRVKNSQLPMSATLNQQA